MIGSPDNKMVRLVKNPRDLGLVYLATPYNHQDPEERIKRFNLACEISAYLMEQGFMIFSPIAHTHPIAQFRDLPKGWDYWQDFDKLMIAACNELWIVKMVGWDRSVGIAKEYTIANQIGRLIRYVNIEDNEIGMDITVSPDPIIKKSIKEQ